MLDTVGENPQGKRLSMCDRFFPRSPIHQDTWEVGNFTDPPAIILSLEFDDEFHDRQSSIPFDR